MEESRDWHYHPNLPLALTTPFKRPFDPKQILYWLKASWLPPSVLPLWVVMAVVYWLVLAPSAEQMKVLQWSWVLPMLGWNLLALTLVAGGLQLYFHRLKKQGIKRKFQAEPQPTGHARFLFRDQVFDNMFWSLCSGVTIWTIYQVLYLWAWANGYTPFAAAVDHPLWFVLLFPLINLWSSLHFYCVHRLLHHPIFYRRFHALHHRMVNIGPWSGIAMHPFEHLLYFSTLLIHFIVPSSPIHFLYHAYLESLNPAVSHNGYGGLEKGGEVMMVSGDFFHQLHHRFLNCNYGTSEFPLDQWFGSFHDGADSTTKVIKERFKAKVLAEHANKDSGV